MKNDDENAPKTHYICQTYVDKKGLKVDKQFEYSTAAQAEERAQREAKSDACVGADAYMVIEDPASGEVGEPVFLSRHGTVPDTDGF